MANKKVTSAIGIDDIMAMSPFEEAAPAETDETAAQPEAAPAAPANAKTTPELSSAEEAPLTTAPDDVEPMRATVADIVRRVVKIEGALSTLEQLEKTITEAKALANQTPRESQDMANQLQEIGDQVGDMSEKLRSTPGYDIAELFRCNSCDSEGLVAIRVKCTECGREKWWGWWPKE